jgi:uncharacterized sodium:solute symporter family permease YidK
MSDNEQMMVHSALMVNTAIIVFFIAVVFLPWFIGLYNPKINLFNGKEMLESTRLVSSALLIAGSVFTFLVGTGWLILSSIFAGFEYIAKKASRASP